MRSIKIKFAAATLIGASALALLELGSWTALKILTSQNNEIVTDTFIFKPMNEDGTFRPGRDWVFPIEENAHYDWIREEWNVKVRTNSSGFREDFEVELKDIKVAFFGDSFTFGYGVNVENRYTNIFAKHTSQFEPKEVVSMSYKNGFQPEHYEYIIRNAEDLKPDIYVIGLYLGNDLDADVKETIYDVETNHLLLPYRLIQSTGQTRVNSSTFSDPVKWLSRHSYFGTVLIKLIGRTSFRRHLFKDGYEGPNAPNAVDLELGKTQLNLNRAMQSVIRIDKIARQRKGKLVVLLIAQNFYFGDDNPHIRGELISRIRQIRNGNNLLKQLKKFCEENLINCVDPTAILTREDFFDKDAHWNSNGHQKVGIFLSEKLIK